VRDDLKLFERRAGQLSEQRREQAVGVLLPEPEQPLHQAEGRVV
jgi:hypothetical protein